MLEDGLRDSDGRAGRGGAAPEPEPDAEREGGPDGGGPDTELSIDAGMEDMAPCATEGGSVSGGREISTARDFSLRAGESVRALPLALRMKVCRGESERRE